MGQYQAEHLSQPNIGIEHARVLSGCGVYATANGLASATATLTSQPCLS